MAVTPTPKTRLLPPGFFRVYEGRFIKNFSVAQDTQLTTAGVLYTSSNTGAFGALQPDAEFERHRIFQEIWFRIGHRR